MILNLEPNNGVLISIIAINMTVIGLTSLAERKIIIGVDYGDFLINKYRLFGIVPMLFMLEVFAIFNCIVLVTMFFNKICPSLYLIELCVLAFCLIFAIRYFFGFILKKNKSVEIQIYKSEMVGRYFKDERSPECKADLESGMVHGWRGDPISSNVLNYFNNVDQETITAFRNLFAPDGFVYKRDKSIVKLCKSRNTEHKEPIDYNDADGLRISYECIRIIRDSDAQSKWFVEVLDLFNNHKDCSNASKLNNLTQIIGLISEFAFTRDCFNPKFFNYLRVFIIDMLEGKLPDGDRVSMYKKREIYMFKSLSAFLSKCISADRDGIYRDRYKSLLSSLLGFEPAANHITRKEIIACLKSDGGDNLKLLVEEMEDEVG